MSRKIDEIAATIRASRQAKALTQKELGQRVGLPQSHISKIEKGAVDLQLDTRKNRVVRCGLVRRGLPPVLLGHNDRTVGLFPAVIKAV